MEKLLPDQLKALWQAVDQKQLTVEAFTSEQERLLGAHRQTWEQALRLAEHQALSESLLAELGVVYAVCRYGRDPAPVRPGRGHAQG